MHALAYFLAFLLALPAAPFALAMLLLQHAVLTRNPFRILFDLLTAFVWGAPITIVLLLALWACTFIPVARPYAAVLLLFLDVLIAAIFFRGARPKSISDTWIMLPTLLSFLLALWVASTLLPHTP